MKLLMEMWSHDFQVHPLCGLNFGGKKNIFEPVGPGAAKHAPIAGPGRPSPDRRARRPPAGRPPPSPAASLAPPPADAPPQPAPAAGGAGACGRHTLPQVVYHLATPEVLPRPQQITTPARFGGSPAAQTALPFPPDRSEKTSEDWRLAPSAACGQHPLVTQ